MKSTKAEVLKRVEEVFKLRLGGAEFADIRDYAAAQEQAWGVSDTQLWRYIAAADKLVKERFDAKAEHLLARHLLQRRTLYAHAMGAGDFRTALAVLKDEADLEGLYTAGQPAPASAPPPTCWPCSKGRPGPCVPSRAPGRWRRPGSSSPWPASPSKPSRPATWQ